MNKKWISYAISAAVSLCMTGLLLILWNVGDLAAAQEIILTVCNSFFAPAMLFICFGLLSMIISTGTLDMLGYGFHSLIRLFTPFRQKENKSGFYEYKVAMEEKRSGRHKPAAVLLVGAADLLIAVIIRMFWNA